MLNFEMARVPKKTEDRDKTTQPLHVTLETCFLSNGHPDTQTHRHTIASRQIDKQTIGKTDKKTTYNRFTAFLLNKFTKIK